MGKEELREELLNSLKDCVVDFEEEKARDLAQQVLDEGIEAYDAVMNGLAAGMEIVGDLYDRHEYFVPEMLMAADTLYAGLEILKPHINMEDLDDKVKGQVVIGTVQGDVHGYLAPMVMPNQQEMLCKKP